jgi:hypothetical protein
MRFYFEPAQQSEKHHNRKSRNECREPPMAKWVVNLNPLHTFSLRREPKACSQKQDRSTQVRCRQPPKSLLCSLNRA